MPTRGVPQYGSKDDPCVISLGNAGIDFIDEIVKLSAKECDGEISRVECRGVERASRFSRWAWVRLDLSKVGGKYMVKVTTNDPNKAGEDVLAATNDLAVLICGVFVRIKATMKKCSEYVVFDDSEFFREAIKKEDEFEMERREEMRIKRINEARERCPHVMVDGNCMNAKSRCANNRNGRCALVKEGDDE